MTTMCLIPAGIALGGIVAVAVGAGVGIGVAGACVGGTGPPCGPPPPLDPEPEHAATVATQAQSAATKATRR